MANAFYRDLIKQGKFNIVLVHLQISDLCMFVSIEIQNQRGRSDAGNWGTNIL